MCGRIIAYQYDDTVVYWRGRRPTIDRDYVAGYQPSVHNNTAGHLQLVFLSFITITSVLVMLPSIFPSHHLRVETYFCESGHNSGPREATFHSDDPLWDGDGCTASSTCCSFNNPPYFTKQLPSPTTDVIEARMCQ